MRLVVNRNKVLFDLTNVDSDAEQLDTCADIPMETLNMVGAHLIARDSGTGAPHQDVADFLRAIHYYM